MATTGLRLTSEVIGILPVANGGTNTNSLLLNGVVIGNGAATPQFVVPSTSGNVLTSNGTTWASSPAVGTIPVYNRFILIGA